MFELFIIRDHDIQKYTLNRAVEYKFAAENSLASCIDKLSQKFS